MRGDREYIGMNTFNLSISPAFSWEESTPIKFSASLIDIIHCDQGFQECQIFTFARAACLRARFIANIKDFTKNFISAKPHISTDHGVKLLIRPSHRFILLYSLFHHLWGLYDKLNWLNLCCLGSHTVTITLMSKLLLNLFKFWINIG